MKKANRRLLVVSSDWHAGNKLGLFNPETVLYEDIIDKGIKVGQKEVHHELTATQEYLWDIQNKCIDEVKRLADGYPVAMIVNGDITHGNRHPEQLLTTSIANQMFIAEANFTPWKEKIPNLDFLRFSFGTASHIFYEGTSPALVNQFIRRTYPDFNSGVVHHGLLDAQGITVDYAHHGPSQGIRLWTEGNQLRYYTKSIMLDALKDGHMPPDIILRSHYHYPKREIVDVKVNQDDGRIKTVVSRIYLTPSMCGLSDYAHQSTRSTHILYNGMMVYEIEDGRIIDDHLDDFIWTLDLRTKETI